MFAITHKERETEREYTSTGSGFPSEYDEYEEDKEEKQFIRSSPTAACQNDA
ncbi:hypothetical protein FOPG_01996 [Fusarium oxysporum f. sp. conglutinans race 2 54008]|uniref:Uncharacterized protein n=5 Tax=Fusarium oxysporum species complex TaxID=171631 RepID=A0A420MKT1_FUSOX|nr:uncharacterized protein FOIG_07953 [Fusarium odoratissimum NRRL 54006]EXL86406.1 hypothetical protein FOPG_01996 [Fusarium oxysporum f. sp. conglutinans race 2 54008]EXM30934.1 hypothetical protein FOTG_03841 [Fusarium oxysporum f. sp. vasinfectum 25433]RKK68630.1 hypothetical protein BFJ69_g13436 [Fusarium oxysporum]TXB98356.1 hypothetical protein FocTR4_00012989 [Fusarium oxysporum f. sp. cubense]EXM01196.1 hypothetical protein FOIG_07953 [Fusarium odoratissimum NRRL 54006]